MAYVSCVLKLVFKWPFPIFCFYNIESNAHNICIYVIFSKNNSICIDRETLMHAVNSVRKKAIRSNFLSLLPIFNQMNMSACLAWRQVIHKTAQKIVFNFYKLQSAVRCVYTCSTTIYTEYAMHVLLFWSLFITYILLMSVSVCVRACSLQWH